MAVCISSLKPKLLCLLVVLGALVNISEALLGNKLLVVLYGGFRWDYSSLTDSPYLEKMTSLGATAHHVDPVFPPGTGPAMYSIATGLYSENHGIMGNKLYDPTILNSTIDLFNASTEVKVKLYEGTEPIWVTASKSGLKTACCHWPGCDVDISGYKADFVGEETNGAKPELQIDRAIKWFTENDVSLVMLHFAEPDHTGHRTGPAPDSQETLAAVRRLDNATGYMLDQLEKHGIAEEVNVLLVGDHGMAAVSVEERSMALFDYINPEDVDVVVGWGARVNLLPAEGRTQDVYDAIKDKHPNVSVYLKDEIPERFHYRENQRVLPIMLLADEGWLVLTNTTALEHVTKGSHGYDNSLMSMKPFFLALGPDIQAQTQIEPFSQVDLCPLMCKLLGLTPDHQGNGTFDAFTQMVRREPADAQAWLILMTVLGVVALILLVGAVTVTCRRQIGYTMVTQRPEEEDEKKYLYHKLEGTNQTL